MLLPDKPAYTRLRFANDGVARCDNRARTLSVSLEELFGEPDSSPRKRGPMSRWQKHIIAIAQLPRAKQKFVAQMLEAVLAQAQQ
ncbi:hypothetical protein [Paraburkholderia caribensis]|uniref:hypothetical protein n=1 Tax=Paraburkholderia caribensis TaxID=75105 RepID=UPI001D094E46|nr:hypothetical protein [Paraburkholderia caribensis]